MVPGEDTLRANADIQEDRTMKQMTENALPIHIHDERNGLDYTLYEDYYLPDLEVPKEQRPIGRWGRMRLVYLKEHRPGLYTRLILSGTLDSHLADVNEQAETRFDTILSGYKRLYGISEQLKAEDQMRWVQMMNLARAEAEASVLDEIICA